MRRHHHVAGERNRRGDAGHPDGRRPDADGRKRSVVHAREDAPVLFQTEVFRLNRARNLEIHILVQQHGAQHEPLSVKICGQTFFEGKIGGSHADERSLPKIRLTAAGFQGKFASAIGCARRSAGR